MNWRTYLLATLIALLTVAVGAQHQGNWPSPPPAADPSAAAKKQGHDSGLDQRVQAAIRQKAIAQQDADKLLELVTNLRQGLSKSPPGTVSVNDLHKSEEIEKLAKRLRKELRAE